MGSTAQELAKAQLAPLSTVAASTRGRAESEEDDIDLSDVESAVTEESYDPNREFTVDAIKWARYQDTFINDNNKCVGGRWMYAVLWKGYLKFPSDNEEPVTSFMHEEDSEGPDFIQEFWASIDVNSRQFAHLKVTGRRSEPLAPPKHLRNKRYDTPDHQMKKWLEATRPRREFAVFVKRRGFERQHPGAPMPKALSDYYVREARKERKRLAHKKGDTNEKGGESAMRGSPTMEDLDILDSDAEGGAVVAEGGKMASKAADVVSLPGKQERGKKRKIRSTASPLSVVKTEQRARDGHVAKKAKRKDKAASSISSVPSAQPVASSSKLAGIGKIKKRIISPEPDAPVPISPPTIHHGPAPITAGPSLPDPTTPSTLPTATIQFGELEPGIFDTPIAQASSPTMAPAAVEPEASSPIIALPTPLFLSAPVATSPRDDIALHDLFPPSPPPPSDPPTPPPDPAQDSPRSEISAAMDIAESPPVDVEGSTPTEIIPTADGSEIGARSKAPELAAPTSEPAIEKSADEDVKDTTESRAEKAVSSPPTASAMSLPIDIKTESIPVLPSQMGKYQQPKRIQLIEPIVTDSAAARIKQAQSYNPLGNIATVNTRATLISPPPRTGRPFHPPTGPSNPNRSLPLPQPAPPPHPHPPSQPRSWGLPARPTVDPAPFALSAPVRGALPLQQNSFVQAGGHAVWKVGGPQTLEVPNSGMSPNPSISSASPTMPQGILLPLIPHPVRAIYNASADPRRRAPEPPRLDQGNLTPMSTISSSSQAFTPRSPLDPIHGTSTGQARNRTPDTVLDLQVNVAPRSESIDPIINLRLLRGSQPMYGRNRLVMVDMLKSANMHPVNLEEMEMYHLGGQLRGGAKILEWVKVAHTRPEDKDKRTEWLGMKARTREDQCFVCYAEDKEARGITHHYAIVFTWAEKIDLSHLDDGGWDKSAMEVVALLVALPLTGPFPLLPNPVTSDLSQTIEAVKTDIGKAVARSVLDSYGFSEEFAGRLTHRRTMVQGFNQPAGDKSKPTSALFKLYKTVVEALIVYNAIPMDSGTPEYHIIWNSNFATRALLSSNVNPNLPRRTVIMTMGPALQLPPALWTLRRVWATGGLVTFTPTFILRSPDKFAEIMRMVRCSANWGAYILPAVVEWASRSWHEPARCPDPSKAFESLTKALFLDHHLLQFSGSAATSGGGLAVTTCPPSHHLPTACVAWLEWRREVFAETDLQRLVDHCRGIRSDTFGKQTERGEVKPAAMKELEQVDIEMEQMTDLTAMRARPHVVPYRRFILIGEMSLDKKMREKLSGAIECVQADDFAAIFSGAV